MSATMQCNTEAVHVLSVENWLEPEELHKQQGDAPDLNKAFISMREGAWSDMQHSVGGELGFPEFVGTETAMNCLRWPVVQEVGGYGW